VKNGQERHDDGELVALYALGALDAETTRAFEAHLAEGCTRCRTELESHAMVAKNLTLAPQPITPPPSVRARVLATIAGREGYQFLREDEGRWYEFTPGVFRKDLGPDAGFLLRMTPGSHIPRHQHAAVEHCWVLRGEVQVVGRDLTVGDYHRAAPGSVHAGIQTKTGCLLLIIDRRIASA
jgi:anti-sigma factor ChrR (cupin superfamily)